MAENMFWYMCFLRSAVLINNEVEIQLERFVERRLSLNYRDLAKCSISLSEEAAILVLKRYWRLYKKYGTLKFLKKYVKMTSGRMICERVTKANGKRPAVFENSSSNRVTLAHRDIDERTKYARFETTLPYDTLKAQQAAISKRTEKIMFLVLDKSGSMAGARIASVKSGAIKTAEKAFSAIKPFTRFVT